LHSKKKNKGTERAITQTIHPHGDDLVLISKI
jgi:hypothetical protein